MKKIANIGYLSVNLERINCIKLIENMLVIEYKVRFEYILNPSTEEWEKHEIIDTVEMEYSNYEMAKGYKTDLDELWEDYLIDNSKD